MSRYPYISARSKFPDGSPRPPQDRVSRVTCPRVPMLPLASAAKSSKQNKVHTCVPILTHGAKTQTASAAFETGVAWLDSRTARGLIIPLQSTLTLTTDRLTSSTLAYFLETALTKSKRFYFGVSCGTAIDLAYLFNPPLC